MPGFLAEQLTLSENYHVAVATETALNLNMPPLEFILDESSGGWSRLDKKLAIAMTIMNKEKCGGCGNPVWVCRNSSNNIDFSVRKGICYAKAAQDKYEERQSKLRNNKTKPGEFVYTVPMQVNGKPIPVGTRSEYYAAEAED